MNPRAILIAAAAGLASISTPANASVTYTVTGIDVLPLLTFHFTTDNFLTGSGTITGVQFDNCTDCVLTFSTSDTFPNDEFIVTSGSSGSGAIEFETGSFGADGTY
jgi:hypothetical protein